MLIVIIYKDINNFETNDQVYIEPVLGDRIYEEIHDLRVKLRTRIYSQFPLGFPNRKGAPGKAFLRAYRVCLSSERADRIMTYFTLLT